MWVLGEAGSNAKVWLNGDSEVGNKVFALALNGMRTVLGETPKSRSKDENLMSLLAISF